MLNSINDISVSLGVSKMTIYRKLKVKMLKPHIIIKQGIQYLDDDGLTLLTNMLKPSCENVKENVKSDVKPVKSDVIGNITNAEIATDKEEYNKSLKSEIEFLRSELQEKNIQISNLNIRLSSEQELHKNTQILFKQQQQPQEDIKLLEEHFNNLDNKLIEVKENMQQRKEEQEQEHKGFFKRLFK